MGPGSDILLRDGSTVHVRDVVGEDADELRRFLESLSRDALWLRFFTAAADLRSAAQWAAGAPERGGMGLVATAGNPPRIVGHAGFELMREDAAEIAFEVTPKMTPIATA